MMTFDDLQDKMTGEVLRWNYGCGDDHEDVIDHIIVYGDTYEIHLAGGHEIELSGADMWGLVATGQTTPPPPEGLKTRTTYSWEEPPYEGKNTNDANIDWEQRAWDLAKMLYCQTPSAREAVQEARAFIAAYRKLICQKRTRRGL